MAKLLKNGCLCINLCKYLQHACGFREKDILKKHYMIVIKLIREIIEMAFDWLPLTLIIFIIIAISQYLFHLYLNFNT